MKQFFKLIRWQNLVIVAITMILMRYAILKPLLSKIQVFIIHGKTGEAIMEVQYPLFNFILLVAATIFIAAGGYIINHHFNISPKISQSKAMTLHNTLNIIGVSIGFYISWQSGYTLFGVVFLIVSGLLYFYSASYKRQFLIGNIIVALLTALVPMLVAIFEWAAIYRYYSINAAETPNLNFIFYWTGGFALFTFLATLIRQIIKDIDDYESNTPYGRNTLPIALGIHTSKVIVTTLIIITLIMLYATWHLFLFDKYTLIYITTLITIH
jgi:4-hydroxybenzoate polyprenyltransferase